MRNRDDKNIVLTPITEEEKDFLLNQNVYILYRTDQSDEIHIDMMSPSVSKYFPEIINKREIANVTAKAYFYNGGENLFNIGRPVYRVRPTENNIVSGYDIVNICPEHSNRVWLEDIVDGNYQEKAHSFVKTR